MRPHLVSLCLAFTLSVSVARAQEGRQPADTARADSASRSFGPVRLEPIVVTATRVPQRRDKIGFATSVVTPDALQLDGGSAGVHPLSNLPGVSLDEAAGPGGPTIVRIRGGEEVFTQILMDGVQVNENGGFFDFQGFNPSNLERIEVTRGPMSALYGSSAMSGVVQFVTRQGLPGRPRFEWSTQGGGATVHGENFRSSMTVAGGAPRFRYSSGYGVGYERGIFAIPHDVWNRDASLRLDAKPSSRVDLTGVLRFAGMDAHLPVRDPGATRVPLDPDARDSRDRIVANLRTAVAATSWWRHELSLSLYHQTFVYDDLVNGVDGTPLGIFVFDANFMQHSTVRRATADYLSTVAIGRPARSAVEVSYGARFEREDLRDRTAGDFGDGDLPLGRATKALHAEVQTQIMPRVSVVAGSRLELIPGQPGQFSPRASAVLELVPDVLSLRAAAGRAFKTPNLQQQYLDNPFIVSNPDLRPETSTGWEAGATARSRDRRFTMTVGYFHQQYRDLIRTVAIPGDTRQINRNLGDSKADGVEWEFAARPATRSSVGVSGAWLKTTILDNAGLSPTEYPTGEALPFRPSVTANAFAEIFVGQVSIMPRVSMVGSQTVLSERFSGQREPLSAYALLGLTAAWHASVWAEPFVRVDNLLNQNYETGYDRRGVPLTVTGGLRVTH